MSNIESNRTINTIIVSNETNPIVVGINNSTQDKTSEFINDITPFIKDSIDILQPMIIKLLDEFNGNKDDVRNKSIPEIIKYMMELVEEIEISGENKKRIVLVLIKQIGKHYLTKEQNDVLDASLDSDLISNMIDVIILASKGEVKLNKIMNIGKRGNIIIDEETFNETINETFDCFLQCFKLFSRNTNTVVDIQSENIPESQPKDEALNGEEKE